MLLVITLALLARTPSTQLHSAPAPQVPVVSQSDIATPTPTPPPRLPTPTPTPIPAPTTAPTFPSALLMASVGDDSPSRSYTVRPGDTLLSVAVETGLNVEEIGCAVSPDFRTDQPLVIGDILDLPPVGVLCHLVAEGESLAGIALRYGLDPDTIYTEAWNRLSDQSLAAVTLATGRFLRIPPQSSGQAADPDHLTWLLAQPVNQGVFAQSAVGGPVAAKPAVPPAASVPENWPYGSGYFTWPVYGWLSQSYHAGHRALDIAAPEGNLVYAADRGVVVRAGWNDQGYGLFVVVDHNIDYLTLYAHLDEIYVRDGQVVAQGDPIGQVGSTGNSTGPHLHFEIRDFGQLTDPLMLLLR